MVIISYDVVVGAVGVIVVFHSSILLWLPLFLLFSLALSLSLSFFEIPVGFFFFLYMSLYLLLFDAGLVLPFLFFVDKLSRPFLGVLDGHLLPIFAALEVLNVVFLSAPLPLFLNHSADYLPYLI